MEQRMWSSIAADLFSSRHCLSLRLLTSNAQPTGCTFDLFVSLIEAGWHERGSLEHGSLEIVAFTQNSRCLSICAPMIAPFFSWKICQSIPLGSPLSTINNLPSFTSKAALVDFVHSFQCKRGCGNHRRNRYQGFFQQEKHDIH